MKTTVEEKGKYTVISIEGDLDVHSSPELKTECDELLGAGRRQLVFDLKDLAFLSSSGIRVILTVARDAKSQGGRLILCGLSEVVQDVIHASGLDQIVPVRESVEKVVG